MQDLTVDKIGKTDHISLHLEEILHKSHLVDTEEGIFIQRQMHSLQ